MDEFGCRGATGRDKAPSIPAEPGLVLEYNKELEDPLLGKKQTLYRSGIGMLLHMMQFYRPDVLTTGSGNCLASCRKPVEITTRC